MTLLSLSISVLNSASLNGCTTSNRKCFLKCRLKVILWRLSLQLGNIVRRGKFKYPADSREVDFLRVTTLL